MKEILAIVVMTLILGIAYEFIARWLGIDSSYIVSVIALYLGLEAKFRR